MLHCEGNDQLLQQDVAGQQRRHMGERGGPTDAGEDATEGNRPGHVLVLPREDGAGQAVGHSLGNDSGRVQHACVCALPRVRIRAKNIL